MTLDVNLGGGRLFRIFQHSLSINALIWAPTFSKTKFLGQQPNGALSKGAERRMQECGDSISNKLVDACNPCNNTFHPKGPCYV
jgi:hypothetical protein